MMLDKNKTYHVDELKDFELPVRGDGFKKFQEEAMKVKNGEKKDFDFTSEDIFEYEKQYIHETFKCGSIQEQLKIFIDSDDVCGDIFFMEQYDKGEDEDGMKHVAIRLERIKVIK